MVQQHSIVAFQNNSVLIIIEEDNQLKKLILQKSIHSEKITTYGQFVHADRQYFYTGSFDKQIKFWSFDGSNLQLVNSSIVQKKITHSFYSNELNSHFVTDKYGDVYSFQINQIIKKEGDLFPEYQNSNNLAIQSAFKDVTTEKDTSYCVLGDSYSKIKIFDLRNMHDLINVWIPFEGTLISILEYEEYVTFLFQMRDKETLEKRFAIHLLSKSKFNENKYLGQNIECIKFADNTIKVRIIKKNDNEFTVYSITDKCEFTAQLYNIQSKNLVKQESSKLNFTLKQNEQLYLHIQNLTNSTISLVGIKSNTPEEIQIEDIQNVEVSTQLQIKKFDTNSDLIIFS